MTQTVAGAVPAVSAATDSLELATAPEGFAVHLENFEGPFDLLLGLIAKHKLDVTEVALSQVTDEFIAYIRARGDDWDLEAATHFLVVAATLLDLKAARLLPAGDVEDEDDLALLEARDLLFARLLQYRAYKDVSAELGPADGGRRASVPPRGRPGTHPGRTAAGGPDRPRAGRFSPRSRLGRWRRGRCRWCRSTHIHAPRVSVREQAALLVERLRRARTLTFRALVADAEDTVVVVARFLALLELYREAAVAFDQMQPLGELHRPLDGCGGGIVGRARRVRRRPPGRVEPGARRGPVSENPTELATEPTETDEDTAAGPSYPSVKAALEAVLMVVDEPIATVSLAQALDVTTDQVAQALVDLAGEYVQQERGFDLREVAGGWRFYSAPDCAAVVERFVRDGQQARLTQASLETLAVIAYQQPVTRARISAVRGVNVDGVIRTLTLRGLIEEVGTEPETGAHLYRTTHYFLERLGVASLDDLPALAPFLPEVEALESDLV